jgi:hypothetical protein
MAAYVRTFEGVKRFVTARRVATFSDPAGAIPIVSNTRLIGVGKDPTVTVSGNGTLLLGLNANNIVIEGITFTRDDFAGASDFDTGIDLRGCTNVLIQGCTFKGFGGMGIRLGQHSGYDPTGRAFDNMGVGDWQTQNVVIRDCEFEWIAGACIGMKPGGASHVDIINNRFRRFGSYGVCAEGDAGGGPRGMVRHVNITDNDFRFGDPAKYHRKQDCLYPLYVGEDAHHITVCGNRAQDNTATNRNYSLYVSTSPSQGDRPVSEVTIDRNVFATPVCLHGGQSAIKGVRLQKNIKPLLLGVVEVTAI